MNQKRPQPTYDELPLTDEELAEISKARDALNAAELEARDAKLSWCLLLEHNTGNAKFQFMPVHRVASIVEKARRKRVIAKAKAKAARKHYFSVSLPKRIRMQRASKTMANQIFTRADPQPEITVVTIKTIVDGNIRRITALTKNNRVQVIDGAESYEDRLRLEARTTEELCKRLNAEIFEMFEALVVMGYAPYGYVPITKTRINPHRPPTLSIEASCMFDLLKDTPQYEILKRVMEVVRRHA